MTFTSPCKRRRRKRRTIGQTQGRCSSGNVLPSTAPRSPASGDTRTHLVAPSFSAIDQADQTLKPSSTSKARWRSHKRAIGMGRHVHMLRPVLLALMGIAAAEGFSVTWPATYVQCEPAIVEIATDGMAGVAGIDVMVRKGPRLDRIFIEEPIAPTATIWNWTAVDVQAGTPIILSILAYAPDNATVGAAISHAMVGLPDNGRPAQIECLQRKRKDDDTRKGIGLELPLIAGILGGILLTLLVLVGFMCWRRRREGSREDSGSFQGHARSSLILNGAEPGAGGSAAGWGYMAAVVPGLAPRPALPPSQVLANRNNPARQQHRWGRRTHRADDGADGELPSYGRSQWEKAKLPRYECGDAQHEDNAATMGGDHEAIMMMPLADNSTRERPYGAMESSEQFDSSLAELHPIHSDATNASQATFAQTRQVVDNAGAGFGTAVGSAMLSNVHRRSRSGASGTPPIASHTTRSTTHMAEALHRAMEQAAGHAPPLDDPAHHPSTQPLHDRSQVQDRHRGFL